MRKELEDLNTVMCRDPGGRGMLSHKVDNPIEELERSLASARRVLLLTGFPVRLPDGSVTGETDGPSGTASAAYALERSGAEVLAATDRWSFPLLQAAMKRRGCRSVPVQLPDDPCGSFLAALFDSFRPTHLITLERPGKAHDGHYYNMRGQAIDDMVIDTSCALSLAKKRGVRTISVGDGGNELGMGAFRPLIEQSVPCGILICADDAADVPLVSGVSNWWGWGIAGILSRLHGEDLLPSPEMEKQVLDAVVAAGGVDGCTKKAEATVDALAFPVHLDILRGVADAFSLCPC